MDTMDLMSYIIKKDGWTKYNLLTAENEAKNSPFYNNSYTVYKSYDYLKDDTVVYSDRLHQWDSDKYKKAASEVFDGYQGQYFDNFTVNQIQNFLSLYFNKQVILTRIDKEENVSNGYPYWVFYYRNKEN